MKKALSVLLSLILVFAMCIPSFAAEATDNAIPQDNEDPIIVVRGIDFAGLVREDGSKALSFDAGLVFDLLSIVGTNMMKGVKNPFVSSVIELAVEVFDPVSCDKEGNPKYPDVHIPKFTQPASELDLSGDEWADTAVGLFRSLKNKFGGDDIYLSTFDWRLSPAQLASELNDLVENVKAATGSDKVDIAACSMGGMITTAYMDIYGTQSIDNLVYLSPALNGGDVVGSAFTGDLVINADALGEFLLAKTNGFVNFLVRTLNALGFVKSLARLVNDFISDNKETIYEDFLRESVGTAYGLWTLIPDEYFDAAVEFFFNDDKAEYSVALEKIAEIREFVFSTEEIVDKAIADGVKVSFVSHYNAKQLPIYSNYTMHGDGVLESKRTSFGGTFAKYGQALSADYIASKDAQFISPDGVADASTCRYPNSTWIVKNAKHVGCKDGSQHTEFAIWLITRNEQPTVTMNSAYPRFMNCDANENFIAF